MQMSTKYEATVTEAPAILTIADSENIGDNTVTCTGFDVCVDDFATNA